MSGQVLRQQAGGDLGREGARAGDGGRPTRERRAAREHQRQHETQAAAAEQRIDLVGALADRRGGRDVRRARAAPTPGGRAGAGSRGRRAGTPLSRGRPPARSRALHASSGKSAPAHRAVATGPRDRRAGRHDPLVERERVDPPGVLPGGHAQGSRAGLASLARGHARDSGHARDMGNNLWFIAAALFLVAAIAAIANSGGVTAGGAFVLAMACFVVGLTQRKK